VLSFLFNGQITFYRAHKPHPALPSPMDAVVSLGGAGSGAAGKAWELACALWSVLARETQGAERGGGIVNEETKGEALVQADTA
jgi:hypothetical protein